MKILVIGGVAAGTKTAAKLKREDRSADAVFVFCAISVFKDPHRSQKLAKKAMVLALISFILGVFRF